MDFLGMGPFEILLVLIIGFLFLGPEKLPTMAAKAGELYRKFTRATVNLTKSITEEVSAEAKATSDLTKSITTVAKEISDEAKVASGLASSVTQDISAEANAISDLTKSATKEKSTETKPIEVEKTPPAPAAGEKSDK